MMIQYLTNLDPASVQKLLEAHKALGPDNISPRLLKETGGFMAPLLTLIFQTPVNYLMNGRKPIWYHVTRKVPEIIPEIIQDITIQFR